MKAVGYKKPSPIDDPESLLDVEVPIRRRHGAIFWLRSKQSRSTRWM